MYMYYNMFQLDVHIGMYMYYDIYINTHSLIDIHAHTPKIDCSLYTQLLYVRVLHMNEPVYDSIVMKIGQS